MDTKKTAKSARSRAAYTPPSIERVGTLADLTRTIKDVGGSDGFTNAEGQDIGVLS